MINSSKMTIRLAAVARWPARSPARSLMQKLFGLLGAGGTALQVSPAGGKALAARVPVCPRPMT